MVNTACVKNQKPIRIVPMGGPGGHTWDDGSYDGVKEINLVYDSCIDTIQVVYNKNGCAVTGEKHGLNIGAHAGTKTAQIKIQSPDEFLTAVTGHYDVLKGLATPVVRSIKFKTNKKTFGPYGVEEGTPFSFGMDGGKIVGLRGRSGWYLDAIGFHIVHI